MVDKGFRHLWEKQEGEDDLWHSRFLTYFLLDVSNPTIHSAYVNFLHSESKRGDKEASRKLQRANRTTDKTWIDAAKKYNWQARRASQRQFSKVIPFDNERQNIYDLAALLFEIKNKSVKRLQRLGDNYDKNFGADLEIEKPRDMVDLVRAAALLSEAQNKEIDSLADIAGIHDILNKQIMTEKYTPSGNPPPDIKRSD